jgi:SAM-dependent methyltransferase
MRETIYDQPLYYDILFGWDRSAEAQFYAAALERYGVLPPGPIAEIACGTGQVARLLARRGWHVTGLDNRPGMLRFLHEQAQAEGLTIDTFCADMQAFSVTQPFAGAFNPMSSFRLLLTDTAAGAHLRAMCAALRPGGIYVLDLTFSGGEPEAAQTTDESWSMSRGGITVAATDAAITVDDCGVRRSLAWGADVHLRPYTCAAFTERVRAAGGFEVAAWHTEIRDVDDGIGRFYVDRRAEPPLVGRAMVVLRRPLTP